MNTQEKTKGEFKPKTKFIEFIGGKGFVNFISNEATIEGKYLSGLEMDGIKFKMTIYKDGSVSLDEIDTNQTTTSQRKRLLEVIEDKTIGSYRGRSVVQELNFFSVTSVKDKLVPLYLAVEVIKPIDKLSSLMSETLKMTDNALENLDDLFSTWLDDGFVEEDEPIQQIEEVNIPQDTINQVQSDYVTQVDSSFQTMKEDKLNELKNSLSKKENELDRLQYELGLTNQTIESLEDEIKLLEDRISDLQPTEPFVGFYFNVSERQNETVTLDEVTEKIIREKVSKVKSINLDNFMKLFSDGEFHIKLSKKTDDGYEPVEDYTKLDEIIKNKLNKFNLTLNDNKLVYVGDLSWSQLVNRLIKMGFEESPEFNKFCGSNSYQSNTETKEDVKKTKTTF